MALQKRWHERQVRWDARFGVLASVAANFSMGKDPDKAPLQPSDFFPTLAEPQHELPEEEMSIEAMWAVFKMAGTGKKN